MSGGADAVLGLWGLGFPPPCLESSSPSCSHTSGIAFAPAPSTGSVPGSAAFVLFKQQSRVGFFQTSLRQIPRDGLCLSAPGRYYRWTGGVSLCSELLPAPPGSPAAGPELRPQPPRGGPDRLRARHRQDRRRERAQIHLGHGAVSIRVCVTA